MGAEGVRPSILFLFLFLILIHSERFNPWKTPQPRKQTPVTPTCFLFGWSQKSVTPEVTSFAKKSSIHRLKNHEDVDCIVWKYMGRLRQSADSFVRDIVHWLLRTTPKTASKIEITRWRGRKTHNSAHARPQGQGWIIRSGNLARKLVVNSTLNSLAFCHVECVNWTTTLVRYKIVLCKIRDLNGLSTSDIQRVQNYTKVEEAATWAACQCVQCTCVDSR